MSLFDISGNPIMQSGGVANTKEYVFFGDSIVCFDKNTGGIGSICEYMTKEVGGVWHNFCIGGTTLGAYRLTNNTYDMFAFGELADSVFSGNFANQEQGVVNGVGAGSTSYSSVQKVNDMKKLDWNKVDTLFIHFGTNDLAYKNNVGTSDDVAQKNGTMTASLKYGVNKILSKYPKMKIVVCGIIYRNADSVPIGNILSANKILKETCEKIGIQFVDLFSEMCLTSSNFSTFLYDGTHPNANGKERYAEVLSKYLSIFVKN